MIDSPKILSHCTRSGSKRQCRLDASFIIYSLAVHSPTYYRPVASPAEDYESRESVEWQCFPVTRDSCSKNTSPLPAGWDTCRSLTYTISNNNHHHGTRHHSLYWPILQKRKLEVKVPRSHTQLTSFQTGIWPKSELQNPNDFVVKHNNASGI